MTSSIEGKTRSILIVSLSLLILLAGLGTQGTLPAAPAAGPLRASATPYTFLFEAPENGSLLGLANPVTAVAVGWYDANPGAFAVAASLYLDGMNLTSAGLLNRSASTFTLPVGFAFRDGPHFVNFAVVDSVGSVGYNNWTFTVDTIPPILIVTSPAYPIVPLAAVYVQGTAFPAFPAAGPVTINVTALPSHLSLSSLANISTGAFSVLMPLTEGVNTLFVNATDAAGNVAADLVPVVRDTTKPTLVVQTPANLSVSPTNLVRVSGLSEFGAFLSVNGFGVTVAPNGTWSVVLALPEGLNVLQIAAADTAGNLNYTGLAVFVDSDAPRITLTSPLPALTNRSSIDISGTVNDTQIVELFIRYNQNFRPLSFDPATGHFSTQLAGLPDGSYTIAVIAVDAAQRTTALTSSVVVDTTPPVVRLILPPDGLETNQSAVVVRGTVEDPNATVLVNDQMVRPDASGRWQTVVGLVPGGNAIYVSAVDAAGNRPAAIVLHVENFSPIPELENRTSANAQHLEELGAVVRFSLMGILLLALGLEWVLYARSTRQIRETRRLVVALVRQRRPKG